MDSWAYYDSSNGISISLGHICEHTYTVFSTLNPYDFFSFLTHQFYFVFLKNLCINVSLSPCWTRSNHHRQPSCVPLHLHWWEWIRSNLLLLYIFGSLQWWKTRDWLKSWLKGTYTTVFASMSLQLIESFYVRPHNTASLGGEKF